MPESEMSVSTSRVTIVGVVSGLSTLSTIFFLSPEHAAVVTSKAVRAITTGNVHNEKARFINYLQLGVAVLSRRSVSTDFTLPEPHFVEFQPEHHVEVVLVQIILSGITVTVLESEIHNRLAVGCGESES